MQLQQNNSVQKISYVWIVPIMLAWAIFPWLYFSFRGVSMAAFDVFSMYSLVCGYALTGLISGFALLYRLCNIEQEDFKKYLIIGYGILAVFFAYSAMFIPGLFILGFDIFGLGAFDFFYSFCVTLYGAVPITLFCFFFARKKHNNLV